MLRSANESLVALFKNIGIIGSQDDLSIINSVYTPYSEAVALVKKRWADAKLKRAVKEHAKLPEPISAFSEPHAMLCRSLIVPNQEFKYFLDVASNADMPYALLEYRSKFVARNQEKRALGKISYITGKGKVGNRLYAKMNVVNFNTEEGKHIDDVQTHWGTPLVSFKRALLHTAYPGTVEHISDITAWFNERRYSTKYYYLDFLSIFVRHGILFENFLLGDKHEREFFFEKVLPSLKRIKSLYGVKPLIVPLLPVESEKDDKWLSYPQELASEILRYTKQD